MTSALFADISSNNPSFDAAAYIRAGHLLIAIKTSEGTGFVNPRHRAWCLDAGAHRVAVMHYHFARPDTGDSPEREAAFFLENALPLAGARDYLCLDLERATPQGWSHDPAWSRAFDRYILHRSRFRTILYSSRSTLQSASGWFEQRHGRVWDADWSEHADYAPPGASVFARQLNDGQIGPGPHELAGVGRCDVNRLNPQTLRHLEHTL